MNDPQTTRIIARHAGIDQDALPLNTPDPTGGGESVRRHYVKSVEWAKCPDHVADATNGLTGLILDGHDQLVFRDHTKKVGKQSIPCPGSGRPYQGDDHT